MAGVRPGRWPGCVQGGLGVLVALLERRPRELQSDDTEHQAVNGADPARCSWQGFQEDGGGVALVPAGMEGHP